MGTDGAWRWREGSRGQVSLSLLGPGGPVDGLSAEHGQGRDDAALSTFPTSRKMNQTLSLHANVMDAQRRAASQGATSPHGSSRLRARPSWCGWRPRGTSGACSPAGTTAAEPGKHRGHPVLQADRCDAGDKLLRPGGRGRTAGRPARPEVLEEIARVTRGKVIGPDKLEEVVRSLAELARTAALGPPRRSCGAIRRWPRTLVLLWRIFWVGRKVVGLI